MTRPTRFALVLSCCLSACSEKGQDITAAIATRTERAQEDGAASGPRCPADDFPAFLRAFAANRAVQRRHTAPVLEIVDWVDIDEPQLGTRVTRVPRDQYGDFKLAYRDGRFVHIEHEASPDPIPVMPRVSPVQGGYRVEYVFGMSEGNSWTFSRAGGCWVLTGEPDPSLL